MYQKLKEIKNSISKVLIEDSQSAQNSIEYIKYSFGTQSLNFTPIAYHFKFPEFAFTLCNQVL